MCVIGLEIVGVFLFVVCNRVILMRNARCKYAMTVREILQLG